MLFPFYARVRLIESEPHTGFFENRVGGARKLISNLAVRQIFSCGRKRITPSHLARQLSLLLSGDSGSPAILADTGRDRLAPSESVVTIASRFFRDRTGTAIADVRGDVANRFSHSAGFFPKTILLCAISAYSASRR